MVLARVQDWASSAAVPFDGRPQGGGHLESTARVRAEGAPDLSIRWAPVPSLEPITLRSNRPSAAAVRLDRSWTLMFRCHDNARALSARYISRSEPQVWTSERRVGALSGTLSCFAVTHPVPPVCDRCLQTGGVSLAHARALVAPPSLCIFHTAIFRRLPCFVHFTTNLPLTGLGV